MPEHYFEFYFFGSVACILAVYLVVYALLDWLGARKRRTARLTHAEEMYRMKGYDARTNVRRV